MYGWETEADKRVLRLLEERFKAPIVFFRPLLQPGNPQVSDGYWHVRIKGHVGVAFVRWDGLGDIHLYGPQQGVYLEEEDNGG